MKVALGMVFFVFVVHIGGAFNLALAAEENIDFGITATKTKIKVGDGGEWPTYSSGDRHIVVDRKTVYAAFTNINSAGETEVCVAKSLDGGIKWKRRVVSHGPTIDSAGVAIAVGPNTDGTKIIHIAWGVNASIEGPKGGIYYSRNVHVPGRNYGVWSDPIIVSSPTSGNWPSGRAIAADGKGGVHIVYSGTNGIFYAKSSSYGQRFANEELVSTDDSNDHEHSIAVDSAGNAFVAWTVRIGPNPGLFLARKLVGSSAWGEQVKVEAADTLETPQLVVLDSSRLYIAYSGRALHVAITTTGGMSSADWQKIAVPPATNIGSTGFAVNAHGVLNIARDSQGIIYFARSKDSGTHWSTPAIISGSPTAPAQLPSLTVDAADKVF